MTDEEVFDWRVRVDVETWLTKDRRVLRVAEMDTPHLVHVLRLIMATVAQRTPWRLAWAQPVAAELWRRCWLRHADCNVNAELSRACADAFEGPRGWLTFDGGERVQLFGDRVEVSTARGRFLRGVKVGDRPGLVFAMVPTGRGRARA